MKKSVLCLWMLLVVAVLTAKAQEPEKPLYSVAFYNLENLFDTLHDAGKNDADFLPGGRYGWNSYKYSHKLRNMARVICELGKERVPRGAALVGVAEVENSRVLSDLTREPAISHYRFVHHEGPDRRGIDCALLYDPAQFKVNHSLLVPSEPFNGDTTHLTRGFLIVDGELAGNHVCVMVNHWPSRGAESPVRVHAARQVKALADSLVRADKRLKLIVMGDLNDDPMDESVMVLGQKKQAEKTRKREFYNPWWEMLEDRGIGTLCYRGKWNLFDQILLNGRLTRARRGLAYEAHEVFRPAYLFQTEEKYKGTPLRTHGGRKWLNGYSDHLPTIVYLRVK